MNNKNFIHPLSSIETIDTAEGKKEVMNSWAFASMIWSGVLDDKPPAIGIAQELFADKSQIPALILRSKQGDETATRKAIAFLVFALDEKLAETFEDKAKS
ncbi:hypothetical protein [Microcoleus sp. herbarium14]|uniref:hypothetical protein n=1 Tax=Microcoleus sp. herbarium14 TaxID=3055439 RepID=UPI002FD728DB